MLETLDEDKAIEQANKSAGRTRGVENVSKLLPAIIQIVKPSDDTTFRTQEVTIEYSAISPTGKRITDVDVRINGSALGARAAVPVSSTSGAPIRLTLTLPPEDVVITLVAREGDRASDPAKVRLRWDGAKPGERSLPRLHALFIGVDAYTKPGLHRLDYSVKDAVDLERFFKGQENRSYAKVETLLLRNPRRADVIKGLKWLQDQSQEQDVNLLFISGHGVTDEQQKFYYMAVDSDPSEASSTGVWGQQIQSAIRELRGARVVMIDACHSGASIDATGLDKQGPVDMNRLSNELGDRSLGVSFYASATGRQLSYENKDYGAGGNGAFTAAIIEGLSGQADQRKRGYVAGDALAYYVRDRVLELTRDRQEPVRMKPDAEPELKLVNLK